VDTLYRRFEWSNRKIAQEWGEENLPKKTRERLRNAAPAAREKIMSEMKEVVHTVKPRKDVNFPVRNVSKTKPFLSFYWMTEGQHSLSEGTFSVFPYNVGRWGSLPGYAYGSSPTIVALPDIRVLNSMNRDLLSYSQMNLFTPLVLDDDGFIPPIEYVPGSMIFKAPGTDAPTQLPVGGRFEITLDMMEQKRLQITRAFFIDFLLRPQKVARQTTFEVADERQQMLQQLGPIFARFKKEFLTTTIQSSFFHLNDMGLFPDVPPTLQGTPLKVSYQGAAAKAQLAIKADNMARFVQDMIPLLQVNPEIIKNVSFDGVAEQFATYRDVNMSIIKSDAEVAAEQAEQRAQQALQNTVDVAAPAASAAKDIAITQSTLAQI